jgi:hypothetical protein
VLKKYLLKIEDTCQFFIKIMQSREGKSKKTTHAETI